MTGDEIINSKSLEFEGFKGYESGTFKKKNKF